MAIKTIPLSRLAENLAQTLNECTESGETVVVEMPNQQLISIQSLDLAADDDLIDELLANDSKFQDLVARSKASLRKLFVPNG